MNFFAFWGGISRRNAGGITGIQIIIISAIVVILIVAAAILFFFKTGVVPGVSQFIPEKESIFVPSTKVRQGRVPVNYIIQGVPPVTIYNHTGTNAYLVTDAAAATKSVLEFYGEKLTPEDVTSINNLIFDAESPGKLYDPNDIISVIKTTGFETEQIKLRTVDDMARFISEGGKMPLIFPNLLTTNQPSEIKFYPFSVLIGILEDKKEFVVHNYYLGYNKHIPFSDFEKLWAYLPPESRYIYLVIKPKSEEYRHKTYEAYPERTDAMSRAEPIINKITLARVAALLKLPDLQYSLSDAAISDPDFDKYIPPYYKIVAYAHLAVKYLFSLPLDIKKAENLTSKAEALNSNLDGPFSDYWPGFIDMTNKIQNITDAPFFLRGVLYRMEGDYDKAIASFNKALGVWPYAKYTKYQLEMAEQLKKKKQNITAVKQIISDEAFQNALIENSPWAVTWSVSGEGFTRDGTQKIDFFLDNGGTVFSGSFLETSDGIKPGPMESVSLKNGCIHFTSAVTGTAYEYCLAKNNTLRGLLSGLSPQKFFFVGDAVARPANR